MGGRAVDRLYTPPINRGTEPRKETAMQKFTNEHEILNALVQVVPFKVRDAIGAQLYAAQNGQQFSRAEADAIIHKHATSDEGCRYALEVLDAIDLEGISRAATAAQYRFTEVDAACDAILAIDCVAVRNEIEKPNLDSVQQILKKVKKA